MKDFKILGIKDNAMALTDQRVIVVELVEVKFQNFELPSGFKLHSVNDEQKTFVVDFSSNQAKRIIEAAIAEEIIRIDENEFRQRQEIKDGKPTSIFYHKNVHITEFDQVIKTREVDFDLLCNKCQTDRKFCSPISASKEMYLGISQFREVLKQLEVECFLCGQKGYAGDLQKFTLTKTQGLDEDLVPSISTHDKRQWYYDLDFIFQHYLKEIFDINEYENVGFAIDFFECRFILKKEFEYEKNDNLIGIYSTEAIAKYNGDTKTVDGKFPFLYKIEKDKSLPKQLIINPRNYSAIEKPLKTNSGTHYVPLLGDKNAT